MRKITIADCRVTVRTEYEDIPVRGNALGSGDDAEDRECEDSILARLEDGDEWAWCAVQVTVVWYGIEETEYLGCCSYADETYFRAGGYFDDMCETALKCIQRQFDAMIAEVTS